MAVLKTRKIKLRDPATDWSLKVDNLFKQAGYIKNYVTDSANQQVEVTYDLKRTKLSDIEGKLLVNGFHLSNGILAKLKRNWLHFSEQNELDNLNVTHNCCSHPDDILNKAK